MTGTVEKAEDLKNGGKILYCHAVNLSIIHFILDFSHSHILKNLYTPLERLKKDSFPFQFIYLLMKLLRRQFTPSERLADTLSGAGKCMNNAVDEMVTKRFLDYWEFEVLPVPKVIDQLKTFMNRHHENALIRLTQLLHTREIAAVVGESGSGKSTLMDMFLGGLSSTRYKIIKIPGSLLAIILSTMANSFFNLKAETIGSRFGKLHALFTLPDFSGITISDVQVLLPSALTIAVLAGIESLLSAVVADGMIGGKHRPNTELAAQGVANIFSALLGGIPATGAIARTAANSNLC